VDEGPRRRRVLGLVAALFALVLTVSNFGLPAAPASAEQLGTPFSRLNLISLTDQGGKTAALNTLVPGDSTFTPQEFWRSAAGAFDAPKATLLAGDFDGDGLPDAAVLRPQGKTAANLSLFISDGTHFSLARSQTITGLPLANARTRLTVGDVDGNGSDDIIAVVPRGKLGILVTALLSTDGGFQSRVLWRSTKAPFDLASARIAGGDLNRDGRADLAIVFKRPTGWVISALLSDGSGLKGFITWKPRLKAKQTYLAVGDLAGEGRALAVVLADLGRGRASIEAFHAKSNTLYRTSTVFRGTLDARRATLCCLDLAGDDKDDVVVMTPAAATTKLTLFVSGPKTSTAPFVWQSAPGQLPFGATKFACASSMPLFIDSGVASFKAGGGALAWVKNTWEGKQLLLHVRAREIRTGRQRTVADRLNAMQAIELAIDGRTLAWTDAGLLHHFDLDTGSDGVIGGPYVYAPAVSGETVVWTQADVEWGAKAGRFLNLSNGQGGTFAPQAWAPCVSGSHLAWLTSWSGSLHACLLGSGSELTVAVPDDRYSLLSAPAVDGNLIAWTARSATTNECDVLGFDLSSGRALEICTASGNQTLVGIAGSLVAWADQRNGGSELRAKDLVSGEEFLICHWGTAGTGGSVWYADLTSDGKAIWAAFLSHGSLFVRKVPQP
jgi:hypothetical protein